MFRKSVYVRTKHSLKKRVLLYAVVAFAFTGPFANAQGVDLSIRFFDTEVYFPDSEIEIKLTLRNDSPEPYRFRLAEDRIFNVEFDVRTLSNRTLEASQEFTNARESNQRVFFRELSLQPGSEYGFVESLGDYVDIRNPGVYVITARFYPDLVAGTAAPMVSDRLMLSVRPQTGEATEMVQQRIDQETAEILEREDIPPDEVVRRTIQARQQQQWNRFFLYMDLESLLRSDPTRERRYLRLSESERREELEEFRGQLRNDRIDEAISAIPDSFEIQRTEYTQQEGQVVASLRFREDGYTAIRRYSYYLRRDDQSWEIYDYTVTNIGTAP